LKKIIPATILFLALILLFFFTISLIAGCNKTTSKQLDIYIWEGYLPDTAAALFEKETGIKLNISFATDTPMMLNLLKGGGKADIVMPTHSHVNRFYEAGLAQPLDLNKIPNYENVSKSIREQPWTKWNNKQMGSGEVYVIPYVFGTSGLVFNTSKYPGTLDNIGWDILFDPDLKDRVSSKNAVDSLWLTLDMLGIPRENLITNTQDTLEQIRPKILELKNNVLKFYGTGAEIVDLMKNEEVWISYIQDGNGRKLSQFDAKFKYILPQTGGQGWADTLMIPTAAVNPSGAYLFIDFMLKPDIAAMITMESGYTTTIDDALGMTEGIDKNLYKFTDEELANLIWYPNLSEEARSISMTFWEEISTVK
jgi:spermidine/putrescine transport system substrate-binding protein